ncbi:tRNA glutamyl-Q(34) synthetase GluQRS [Parvularcula sp. ZS-1/3]|uniref:tRNA glutamyl-Q(34) synthetase GluQRS n=1 Tax=Parvularcula mediterranea TaxID=2732508 RepID=A0A7Y3RMV8_9PROT|nr:tRNA glutamyl-Q(34) synthetase GluQRS [Parvularcula mediterranea]
MPQPITTRFAPSPTGLLHLGHAFSAILNHDEARKSGGRFVLRIEDIDQGRCRPEFEQAILRDLEWLGLEWDGEVRRQSERVSVYEEALQGLADRGLLYRCFKTRAELRELAGAPHGDEARPPVTAPLPRAEEEALLAEGKSFAWRLNTARAIDAVGSDHLEADVESGEGAPERRSLSLSGLDDPVLARKDFPTSYHMASVLDDADQSVDLVWRGIDLEDALPLHRLLQELMSLPAPRYRHHRLILDADGKRLAKRDKSVTLEAMREAGVTPEDVRRQLELPAST